MDCRVRPGNDALGISPLSPSAEQMIEQPEIEPAIVGMRRA
jgi:hypothetical protein